MSRLVAAHKKNANCGLLDKSVLPLTFKNKVWGEDNKLPIHLPIVCGCFCDKRLEYFLLEISLFALL